MVENNEHRVNIEQLQKTLNIDQNFNIFIAKNDISPQVKWYQKGRKITSEHRNRGLDETEASGPCSIGISSQFAASLNSNAMSIFAKKGFRHLNEHSCKAYVS